MNKMVITENMQYHCPEVVIGDWRAIIPEAVWGVDLAAFFDENLYDKTLYGFIGLNLHSVQQGQSLLFFKGLHVRAEHLADTCGSSVIPETLLFVGNVHMPVALLSADFKLKGTK